MEAITLLTLLNFGISGGYSLQNLTPNFASNVDYSYRFDGGSGSDFALSCFMDLSQKLRGNVRLSLNNGSSEIYHWVRTSALEEQTMDGFLNHNTLGIVLMPEMHHGESIELFYGAGIYGGVLLNSGFTGSITRRTRDQVQQFNLVNEPDQSFNNVCSAFILSAGLRGWVTSNIGISLTADFMRFGQAKNLIFQDIGNITELNFRAGVVFNFKARE